MEIYLPLPVKRESIV